MNNSAQKGTFSLLSKDEGDHPISLSNRRSWTPAECDLLVQFSFSENLQCNSCNVDAHDTKREILNFIFG